MSGVERLTAAMTKAGWYPPESTHARRVAESFAAADPGLAVAIEHGLACPVEQERDALAGQVPDPAAMSIAQADAYVVAAEALAEAAREASTKDADARAVMLRMGIVLDRWPVKDHQGEWTDEQIAALDPETRWQGLAFTLYSILALEMAAPLDRALAEFERVKAAQK